MLCPRCNSENDLGEKFCKFCGAPLTDTDLVYNLKEKVKKQKQKRIKVPKQKIQRPNSQSQRTYSLDEKAYRRDKIGPIISLAKSLVILIILVIAIYFLAMFILTKNASSTDNYSIGGDSVPSVKYVLGQREISKIKYNYKDGVLSKTYYFKDMENLANDLIKYVGYLMENNSYEILTDFNPTVDGGSTKLAATSLKTYGSLDVIEISWSGKDCTMKMYRDLETKVKQMVK